MVAFFLYVAVLNPLESTRTAETSGERAADATSKLNPRLADSLAHEAACVDRGRFLMKDRFSCVRDVRICLRTDVEGR